MTNRLSTILVIVGFAALILSLGGRLIVQQAHGHPTSPQPQALRSEVYDTASGAPAQLVLAELDGCSYVIAYRCRFEESGVSVVHHAACRNPAHTRP
jgi:hypothetical protein